MLAPTKVFHNLFTVKIHRKLLLVKNEIRMTIYKMLIVLKIYTTLAQQVLSMTFEGFCDQKIEQRAKYCIKTRIMPKN